LGNKKSIFETVLKFFEEDGWRFSKIEDKDVLRMGYSGKNISMRCFAEADEEHQHFFFYSLLEFHAPEEKRQEIAEFITRANYGLKLGNFEMDYFDGEIRFKTSVDVEGGELTTDMINAQVYANVRTMDKFGPGIMAVLYGDVSPAAALARIEG
jgi:hypothetical protein